MVKRTITITTIFLILTMIVGLLVMLNKSSFAADDDIASGTCGSCSWVIDSEGTLTISPIDGVSGTLNDNDFQGTSYLKQWWNTGLPRRINKVIVENGVKTGQQCIEMFSGLYNCTEIDLSGLDTSNATNMKGMFSGCSSITYLDVSNFDTSKVTNMSNMFNGCRRLETLDLTNFDVSKVTNISEMFSGLNVSSNNSTACISLTSIIGINQWNTSNFIKISGLFNGCKSLQSLDVSDWDVSNVESFDYVFSFCKSLTSLDVSKWDISSATSISYMFGYCSGVTALEVSNFNTSNVTDMSYAFAGCSMIQTLDIANWDLGKVTDLTAMFKECQLLKTIDVSNWNVENVTQMGWLFENCYELEEIDISNWNTSNLTTWYSMFTRCRSIKHLDFSNWDFSNVGTTWSGNGGLFEGCASLLEIDLTGLTTSKGYRMFYACRALEKANISDMKTKEEDYSLYGMFVYTNKLKEVNLGKNFGFKGNSSMTGELHNDAILCNPPQNDYYTGKWIREDGVYGPYTAAELRDNYDGSIMAGTWIWEKRDYTVNYSFINSVPDGASELPEARIYGAGEIVEVAPDATAPGYTFSGWSRTSTFEMPAENVEITGSFTANTDTPYKVEHYLEDLAEGTYTLTKTDNLTGTTDTEVQAIAKKYEGFTFDNSVVGTKLSGNIAGDGSLVLKVYYKRNSYNVTYAYTGNVPNDASSLPQGETYKYGAKIIVPENATAEGYTFSGWIKDYITMPAQDIEITGYFIENPKSYKYKIEYYFDGELDDSLEEILNAEKDEEISLTPQTPLKHGEKNYTLVSNNHKITVSTNEAKNIIKIYYETDVLDYEIDNSEDTIEGDGIPDKYQIKITYKVENGSWDDGTTNTKTDIITLKDKDGNLLEEGTGTTSIPEVGNKPSEEYEVGSWNEEIPKEVSYKDNGKEYIYSYKKSEKQNIEQKEDIDITEASGKIYNPKTDDIVNKYLLVGIGGLLVLMIVRKIKRKYSRKAKRIQF